MAELVPGLRLVCQDYSQIAHQLTPSTALNSMSRRRGVEACRPSSQTAEHPIDQSSARGRLDAVAALHGSASDTPRPRIDTAHRHPQMAFRLCGVLLLCAARPICFRIRLEPKVVTPPMHQGACAAGVLRCRDTGESAVWDGA